VAEPLQSAACPQSRSCPVEAFREAAQAEMRLEDAGALSTLASLAEAARAFSRGEVLRETLEAAGHLDRLPSKISSQSSCSTGPPSDAGDCTADSECELLPPSPQHGLLSAPTPVVLSVHPAQHVAWQWTPTTPTAPLQFPAPRAVPPPPTAPPRLPQTAPVALPPAKLSHAPPPAPNHAGLPLGYGEVAPSTPPGMDCAPPAADGNSAQPERRRRRRKRGGTRRLSGARRRAAAAAATDASEDGAEDSDDADVEAIVAAENVGSGCGSASVDA